jgi:hypothetical protein
MFVLVTLLHAIVLIILTILLNMKGFRKAVVFNKKGSRREPFLLCASRYNAIKKAA